MFNPNLVVNVGLAVYSRTAAAGMLQTPMSWDTLGGTVPGQPGQPGSIVLGAPATQRVGLQSIPANQDPLMIDILNNQPGFTFGRTFTPSENTAALPSGGVGLGLPGESSVPVALPISAVPNPALVGTKLGLAVFGIQFDAAALTLGIAEVANGMTLNLQN